MELLSLGFHLFAWTHYLTQTLLAVAEHCDKSRLYLQMFGDGIIMSSPNFQVAELHTSQSSAGRCAVTLLPSLTENTGQEESIVFLRGTTMQNYRYNALDPLLSQVCSQSSVGEVEAFVSGFCHRVAV